MKTQFKYGEKEFPFQPGDEVKIICTSFLYADERQPERIYTATVDQIKHDGFWAALTSMTVHPYSRNERLPGQMEPLQGEDFFRFLSIEEVISAATDYPDRRDSLIRFALDNT